MESEDKLKMREMNQAMLYHHTGINKGLKERYEKKNLWKEYLPIILSVGFIIMIGVMTWLLFDKWITLAQTTNVGVETSAKVLEKADSILGKLDNLISHQTSGYVATGGG